MKAIRIAASELVGMFVDDGNLALFISLLIGAVTVLIKLAHMPPLFGGLLLLGGCMAILAESTSRAARHR